MNILHILRDLDLTGVPKFVTNFVACSSKNSFPIKNYIFCTHSGILKNELEKNTLVFCSNKKYHFSILPIIKLFFILRKKHINVLHVHSNPYGIILAFLSNLPTVITFHVSPSFRIMEEKIIKKLLVILRNRENIRFVAVSNFIRGEIIKVLDNNGEKTITVYNGIPLEQKRKDYEIKFYEGIIIGAVGSLSEIKGHRYLIEAVYLLRNKGIKLNCFIAGMGPLYHYLDRLVKELNLQEEVKFVGILPFDEFIKKYKINILVVPSLHETFGLTILEGWEWGLPVIASNVEGPAEIIEDRKCGLLFKAGNAISLANTIETLINDDKLAKTIIIEGKKKLISFDITKTIASYIKIYNEITGLN